MTTIAWDGKNIATDSRATKGNNILQGNIVKLHKVEGTFKDENLIAIGAAGSLSRLEDIVDWISKGGKPEEMPPGTLNSTDMTSTLVITNKGCWCFEFDKHPFKVPGKYAIGSGSEFAISAMSLGISAMDAVHHAIKHDCFSGGPVLTLDSSTDLKEIKEVGPSFNLSTESMQTQLASSEW